MVSAEIIIPSIALRPFVHHYWVLKTCNVNMSTIIMPSPCIRWMFHRKKTFAVEGESGKEPMASVVGLSDRAIGITNTEDVEMIMVFFHPFAAQMIMGIPSGLFAQHNVDFGSLESATFSDLERRVLDAEDTEECIRLIEDFILSQLVKTGDSPYLKPLTKVFSLMVCNPTLRIEEMASAACMSERHFRRVFIDNVGFKPKQIQRVQRFLLATNEILCQSPDNLDALIYRYGYTDHSHFNREFHDIAGMSPSGYIGFLDTLCKRGIMPEYRLYHSPMSS